MSHKTAKQDRQANRIPKAQQPPPPRRSVLKWILGGLGAAGAAVAWEVLKRLTDDGYDWARKSITDALQRDGARLGREFPKGYAAFALVDGHVVSGPTKATESIVVDWSTAAVRQVTPDQILLTLPDLTINKSQFHRISIGGPNRLGRWPPAMIIDDWIVYVEVVETTPRYVVAAIGIVRR